jgi:isoaspartyl peptidase/L-asparaginase-like protein (Ntn-hydrolase superfamily)
MEICPGLIVHSGAGYFQDDKNEDKLRVTKGAALVGWRSLLSNDDPLDAVEAAVKFMEDEENCNAGGCGFSF